LTNDYSVCATWAETENGYYLLDLWRNKVEMPELERAIVQQYNRYQPNAVVIEDKSSGIGVIQTLRQKTRLPIIAYDPKMRDKESRAASATPTVEAGNCYLPENAPWVEEFISEHERFPNSEHDDMCDTSSMMVEYMKQRVAVARVTLL
jgi:predicted phage terminase large subunit-like protein